jgi:topoisomerase-4 subunit A
VDTERLVHIQKMDENIVLSAVYFDGASQNYYVKRFQIEVKTDLKEHSFISEDEKSKLIVASTASNPMIQFEVLKGKSKEVVEEVIDLSEFIDVKGWKSLGNRMTQFPLKEGITLQTAHLELEYEVPVKPEKEQPTLEEVEKQVKDFQIDKSDLAQGGIQSTLF